MSETERKEEPWAEERGTIDVPPPQLGPAMDAEADNRARWGMIGLAVASSVGAAMYHGLMWSGYRHSALMFLGLPAILAILLALTPKAKTVTGGIIKGITLMLLVVAPILGEGYLCIVFAAPLFYLMGVGIGLGVDWTRKRDASRGKTLSCVAILLLPFCLEGAVPWLTHERAQVVVVTRVVEAPATAVEAALSESPRVNIRLPRFLRIGFPRPLWATGRGLRIGDERRIHFSGAEGDPEGDLVLRVEESRPGYVRFRRVSDASKLTQWIAWDSSEVRWRAVDATHTEVTAEMDFERQLDPYWYFAPWERLAVRKAAEYMIVASASPERQP